MRPKKQGRQFNGLGIQDYIYIIEEKHSIMENETMKTSGKDKGRLYFDIINPDDLQIIN